MKILVIQVGNYTQKANLLKGVKYIKCKTLNHGIQYFNEKQIINNIQTRESIEKCGLDVEYYFHTDRKSILGLLQSSYRIRQLINEIKPDLTHVYWGGISGLLVALFARGKILVSFLGSDLYGSYTKNGRRKLSSKIQTYSSLLTPFFVNGIIVMSNGMKDYNYPFFRNKIYVQPEGVSLEKFNDINKIDARTKIKWKLDKFIIIFFFEGQAVKNFNLAKEAFDILKNKINKVEFKIINGISHDELMLVYNAADLLLMTSLHEGSNNSIKEAMACNLPIISVRCGDAEERISDVNNCFICDYSVEDIVKAILQVYQNNKKTNGRDFISSLSLENCAKNTIDIYKNII